MKIPSYYKWLVKAPGKHDWMNSISLLNYNLVENTYQYHHYSNLEPFWFLDSAVIFFVQLPVGPLYHYFSPKCSPIQWFHGSLCPLLPSDLDCCRVPFPVMSLPLKKPTVQCSVTTMDPSSNLPSPDIYYLLHASSVPHSWFSYHFPICQMNSNFLKIN